MPAILHSPIVARLVSNVVPIGISVAEELRRPASEIDRPVFRKTGPSEEEDMSLGVTQGMASGIQNSGTLVSGVPPPTTSAKSLSGPTCQSVGFADVSTGRL